jgi:putative membrane protein
MRRLAGRLVVTDKESAMMYWYSNGMGGWSYALMTVNMLLFWGLVVGAIVALMRYLGGTGRATRGPQAESDAPERILAQRFARGEVDEEEYRRRLTVVRERPSR